MDVVNIDDQWRIVRVDRLNWEVQEHRAPNVTHKTKTLDARWMGTGNFFPSVPMACEWLLQHRMISEPGGVETLESHTRRMRGVAEGMAKAVRDAMKGKFSDGSDEGEGE